MLVNNNATIYTNAISEADHDRLTGSSSGSNGHPKQAQAAAGRRLVGSSPRSISCRRDSSGSSGRAGSFTIQFHDKDDCGDLVIERASMAIHYKNHVTRRQRVEIYLRDDTTFRDGDRSYTSTTSLPGGMWPMPPLHTSRYHVEFESRKGDRPPRLTLHFGLGKTVCPGALKAFTLTLLESNFRTNALDDPLCKACGVLACNALAFTASLIVRCAAVPVVMPIQGAIDGLSRVFNVRPPQFARGLM